MKFNFKRQGPVQSTINHAGGESFTLTPQMELYTAVATAGLSDQYYEKANDKLERLRSLLAATDPVFAAKLAVYAREKMYLRSIPLVMAVELAKQQSGNGVVGKLTEKVVQRADEITELLAYYATANQRQGTKQLNKLSKQLQKGLAAAFNKFDEYQFAKYNGDGAVQLRDALFIVHPKAKNEAQQAVFDKIATDTLATPYTWEVELSALGQQSFESAAAKQAAVKAKWEELIFSNKLGYMATLRNLRNMLNAGIGQAALDKVCAYIGDAQAVAKSKQLPFRFLSAYRELKAAPTGQTGQLLDALEAAVEATAANIAGFGSGTRVVIAADVSGSMQQAVSPKSKVLYYDIGLLLAMLLQSRCQNVITGIFGDRWKAVGLPKKNILANVEAFYKREGEVGYSTNGYLVIKDLLQQKRIVDKVMIFTDCQLWNSNNSQETIAGMWKLYKQIAPDAKLYLFDLAGHGTAPLNILREDVFLIAGWSDKIFQVLEAIEAGGDALRVIDNMEW
jgi:60 kDa SS-A/Ro ribonucleoprotein